ncbi:MAG: hypothetical protein GY714_18080 [Desulfobacterales bacterium]|nr:hypothetical protein [Desulfobacterales bacterium]
MIIPFKTNLVDGDENVMDLTGLNPSEIRFNYKSRSISIVCKDEYTLEDLDGLSWQEIKKLVIENEGTWDNKASGIEYLIGRSK